MEYLDPKQERAHMIRLIVGYVLVGVAILIGTLILLYQAYGYGLGKDGEVIQNGLVFLSSQPNNAEIHLNNKLYRDRTNAKLSLPEGAYETVLKRTGYNDWERKVVVAGGTVQHFNYPKLFPAELKTSEVKSYGSAPGLVTESPDRKWLLIQQPGSLVSFDLFDISNVDRLAERMTSVSLPVELLTSAGTGSHSLKLAEWSTDNRHVMLTHNYNTGTGDVNEYILLDRQEPASSLNLTRTLSLSATKQLQLYDKKFDQYYVYDTADRTVGRMSVSSAATITPVLENVLAYKPYGKNTVLYVTDKDAPTSEALSMLYDDGSTYKIREHGAAGPYLIDLARYSNDWYVVVGASGDDKVYIYKNPQSARKNIGAKALVPVQIMRMDAPNKLQFSSTTQFVMIQNGTNFAVYDAETGKGYRYVSGFVIDAPATTASWMDGQRLMYVSGGRAAVFDYDNINGRKLAAAIPDYVPFFDRDYENLYTLAPGEGDAIALTVTSMLTPADQ